MTATANKTIICKCGSEFPAQLSYSGIIVSKYCPQCRYNAEIAKRKEKACKVAEIDIKIAKTALKSKLPRNPEKKPKSTDRKLISILDKEFSLFIRHRDSKNGMFICISCGLPKPFRLADCGHFINRQHMSTRYDEINCNAQCSNCNRFKEGAFQGYRIGLIKRYGEQAVNMLDVKKAFTKKFSVFELELMIKDYRTKNREYEKLHSGELF